MKTVTAAIIARGDDVLICQRRSDQPLPLQWEFPGGKLEQCEDPRECLTRELREEIGVDAAIGEEVARFTYQYPGHEPILLLFFKAEIRGEPQNLVFNEVRWAARAQLPEFDFLAADKKLIEEVARGSIA